MAFQPLKSIKIKGREPELLLTFQEYTDTWQAIIQDFHHRAISSDEIFGVLDGSDKDAVHLSMELYTLFLIIAMRAWNAKKMKEDAKERVEQAVVNKVYSLAVGSEGEALEACKALYTQRYGNFVKAAPGNSDKAESIRKEHLAFARYTIAQCSDKTEDENENAIRALYELTMAAEKVMNNLSANSVMDSTSMISKYPRFLVRKTH